MLPAQLAFSGVQELWNRRGESGANELLLPLASDAAVEAQSFHNAHHPLIFCCVSQRVTENLSAELREFVGNS